MYYLFKMVVFIFMCLGLASFLWLYKNDNRTVHNFYSTYSTLFGELDQYGFIVKSYFQSLFTFTLISLLLSLFGFPSNVFYNGDFSFFYILSGINLVAFAVAGIKKNGLRKVVKSFFIPIGDSRFLLPLSIFVSVLLFAMTYVIKPIVLPSRIALNGLIGKTMHEAMEHVPYGCVFAFFITGIKLIVYFIQAYIFYVFSLDLFKHLYNLK